MIGSRISFTADEVLNMDRLQSGSFYWLLKKRVLSFVFDRFVKSGDVICDFGCGTGFLISESLASRVSYYGVDAFEESLVLTAKNVPTAKKLICGGADEISALPEKLDVILLLDVLEHIDDDERFLELLFENLRSGGLLVLSVPAHQWLFSDADVKSGHFRRYSSRGLRELVRSAGFTEQFLSSFVILSFPLLVASRVGAKILGRYTIEGEHSSLANKILIWFIGLETLLSRTGVFHFGGSIYGVWKKR